MVDYDGKIACTVFTEGCNFRCPFCQNGALVVGAGENEPYSDKEIFGYLEQRKKLVDAVCISGGEPTLNKDLSDFIKRVKDMGFLVKLDTNGYKPDVLRALTDAKLLDYVAMDIKADKKRYARVAGLNGLDISKIEESVKLVMESGVDYEFRTTLMAQFHDEECMRSVADWIDGAKRYFMQKYKDGEGCIAHGFSPVAREEAERFCLFFQNKVKKVGLRGY